MSALTARLPAQGLSPSVPLLFSPSLQPATAAALSLTTIPCALPVAPSHQHHSPLVAQTPCRCRRGDSVPLNPRLTSSSTTARFHTSLSATLASIRWFSLPINSIPIGYKPTKPCQKTTSHTPTPPHPVWLPLPPPPPLPVSAVFPSSPCPFPKLEGMTHADTGLHGSSLPPSPSSSLPPSLPPIIPHSLGSPLWHQELPRYRSFDQLQRRLALALREGSEGFGEA